MKEMYLQRIEKFIDPNIQFCHYNINRASGKAPVNTGDIVSLIQESQGEALDLLKAKLNVRIFII